MALRQSVAHFARCVRGATQAQPLWDDGFRGALQEGRTAATLAAVKSRIKSVQNIKKITSAMKMVAASKMRKAQAAQSQARGMPVTFIKLLGEETNLPVRKTVNVPLSSDKGMCGGINSQIAKLASACVNIDVEDKEKSVSIVSVGSKGGGVLRRTQADKIEALLSEYSKQTINFALASAVSEEILKTEYDSVRLLYNSFKSAISFRPTVATVLSPETLEKSDVVAERIDAYEMEGPPRAEMLQDLAEFQLASMMFYAMNEACTAEHASRMQAMENSSKNSAEMLESLTLSYNRNRQAKITTELNEIISGAVSLEG